jgi:hypothetical protein
MRLVVTLATIHRTYLRASASLRFGRRSATKRGRAILVARASQSNLSNAAPSRTTLTVCPAIQPLPSGDVRTDRVSSSAALPSRAAK